MKATIENVKDFSQKTKCNNCDRRSCNGDISTKPNTYTGERIPLDIIKCKGQIKPTSGFKLGEIALSSNPQGIQDTFLQDGLKHINLNLIKM